ncbi:YhgE/Pip domain protein [Aedoeadaptatus nemausensis]|uniref:YhgE/Pip domain protein n=1 Tax=Aedoeadaptatus nemausensis TaxID=2582829 RepID=A0A6V6XYQ2_9FIRM|nr:YhgE/Pip family protein [Peptoniphilus nemausensis]CAC9922750.1 YhgE/Pip domain protein [Peptoniphilus nemausensis]
MEKLNLFLKQDTEDLSRFLSGPVGTNTHRLYPVENYGSAMAAFYTTLSLWVGAVIQVALINVSTPKSYTEKYGAFKPHETYFGRLALFIAISLIQSTFITLGNLYFLGVQCLHPGYFLLASWVAGMVFTILIYTLTISFGDIGKAICVVLMVIQVAGSGGTFPIDVAPSFFRNLYVYLPFVHSMNAMKETIAGFYGNIYFKELMILQVYVAASLLLGLVLRKPLMHLNEVFEEKLEDTKLM